MYDYSRERYDAEQHERRYNFKPSRSEQLRELMEDDREPSDEEEDRETDVPNWNEL